jgi:hypothetical protein
MIIKKFESFSQDLPYEEKTKKDWGENKKNSVKLDLDEVLEVADYLIFEGYITLYFRPNGERTFRKSFVKQIEDDIRNGDDIYIFGIDYFGVDYDIYFFKDDDEWWWFKQEDKIFRCDEMFGLKALLDKLGYSKKSKNI